MKRTVSILILLFVFAGKGFSQEVYTSNNGYSFTIPAAWKNMPDKVYFGGKFTGDITMQTMGIEKGLMLASSDTLIRPYVTIFALGNTGTQDFETSIFDANDVMGMGIMEFTSLDDIKSLMLANPKKVFVDKGRKIVIGEGDPDPAHPEYRTIAATLMGATKGVLFVYNSDATNLSSDIDKFLEIIQTVHVD